MPDIKFQDFIGPPSQKNPRKRQRLNASSLVINAWAKELNDDIPIEDKKKEWLKVLEHDGSKLSWADPSFHADSECISSALKQNITSLDDMYSSTENLRPIIEEETLKLIKKNPSLLSQCKALTKQLDFIKKAIETNAWTYCYLSLSYKKNEALASLAVKNMGSLLKFLPLAFKSNSAIVLLAIRNNIDSFLHANGQLKANPAFILNAIKINPKAFIFAKNNLQANPEFVLSAIKINPKVFDFASNNLQANPEFVLNAIKVNPKALYFASKNLRTDSNFVLNAIKINPEAIYFSSKNLQSDPDFVSKAIEINPKLFNDEADNLK